MSIIALPVSYCTVDFYRYKVVHSGGNTIIYYWDKRFNAPYTVPLTGTTIPEFQAEDNEIIGVIENEFGGTSIIVFDESIGSGYNSGEYPKRFLKKIDLVGTNGSKSVKLLKTVSTESPSDLSIYTFNTSNNAETLFSFDAPQCFLDYSRPTDELLKSSCTGFTRNKWYHDGDGGVTIEYEANSVACGFIAEAEPHIITQVQRIELRTPCTNPVYFKWKNLLGGWDQWVFQKKQTYTDEINSKGSFVKTYFELSDFSNPEIELGKESQPLMTLGADNLTTQQKKGLMHLLKSNKVMMMNESGTFTEVRISSGSFIQNETDRNIHSLEFEVILPKINTISN